MKAKKWLFRAAALAVVLAVAAVMMVIGRGHTIYVDNKTAEYNGQSYKSYDKVEVSIRGQETEKLYPRERCMATWIGQDFTMNLVITGEDGQKTPYSVNLSLPYNIDGIILNIPALMAGLPEEAWLSEFIPTPTAAEESGEETGEVGTDEFGTGDMGDMGM